MLLASSAEPDNAVRLHLSNHLRQQAEVVYEVDDGRQVRVDSLNFEISHTVPGASRAISSCICIDCLLLLPLLM